MGIVLAIAAAVTFGTADFVGGVASRRSSALLVTLIAEVAGFLLLLPAVLLFPAAPSREALLWGAVAGVSGGLALVVFYQALARGVMSVVSPLAAAVSAGIPVVVGVAGGERLSIGAWLGLGAAALAVTLVGSARSETAGRVAVLRSVGMALLAGAGFGLFFTALGKAPPDSGAWPLVATRIGSLAVLALVILGVRGEWRAPGSSLRLAIVAGLLDMAANGMYLLATRQGELAISALLASQYPAVTVLLSMGFLGERLRARQLVGVGLALASVALIAAV